MASRNASMDETSITTTLARPYVWIYSIFIGLFLLFVWMVLVNLFFMTSVWSENEGLHLITTIIDHDMKFAPQLLANRLADWSYAVLFKFSGIDGLLITATTPGAKLTPWDAVLINGFLRPYAEGIATLMQSARLIGVRIAIVINVMVIALPIFFAALIDGVVQRYVRRECAGRESSGLYHRAKYIQFIGGFLMAMIYTTLPVSISPQWLFAWAAIAALLIFLQTKFYKKYL